MTGIHIKNYDSERGLSGQTWDTGQLQADFEVLGFSAPFVVVKRKSDGKRGTLEFKHGPPRIYFDFQEEAS